MDDLEIIVDCQEGRLTEFTVLYEKYLRKIYNYIYFRTCFKETAEDTCSQTFIKALENINKFNPKKGNFNSWLYAIARNLIIDHFRALKHTEDIHSFWDLPSSENIAISVNNKFTIQEVKKYLEKLKPEQKEIVLLRIWDGMSFREIADLTSKTEENCKVIFFRSMKFLRSNVEFLLFLILLKSNFKI